MMWQLSSRGDPLACALADRHYTRQTVGSPQMMPSGSTVVLMTPDGDAVWGSSWQRSGDTLYAVHDWPDAWVCSIFRNESPHLSSVLIREAVAATRYEWGDPPSQGMVSFVDPGKVRHKRDPGRCFIKAGFVYCGSTRSGKVALVLHASEMPMAEPAIAAGRLFARTWQEPRRRRSYIGGPIVDVGGEPA